MGSSDSGLYNNKGEQVTNRKCIILVTPPTYEVSKLVAKLPEDMGYEYVSIGQLIRDQINKKTNYSKIILQNLEQHKKINEKILDILLKNAALLGNFMIRFAPRDESQLKIWKSFMSKVTVAHVIIVDSDADHQVSKRSSYQEKVQLYMKDVRDIQTLVSKEKVMFVKPQDNAVQQIVAKVRGYY